MYALFSTIDGSFDWETLHFILSLIGVVWFSEQNSFWKHVGQAQKEKRKFLDRRFLTDYRHFAPAMFRYRKRQFAPDPTCVSLPFFNFDFHNFFLYFYS